jgi:hypothetical protein
MNRLNNATDKQELEKQLKMLHRDINLGRSLPGTLEEKISRMKSQVLDFSQRLKNQIDLKPSANKMVTSSKQEIEKNIGEIANHLEKNKRNLCENPLPLLSTTQLSEGLASLIIKPDVVTELFKKWLPSTKFILELRYRGSKHGYDATAFHRKCDNVQHTITVIENSNGKVLGGYSDQTWNETEGGYKSSYQSFLFSITDKEIYRLKTVPNQYAICAKANCGPTFGKGHDLHIGNKCNTGTSYRYAGNSYDSKGKTGEQMGGSTNFTVKEIEVFAVKFS